MTNYNNEKVILDSSKLNTGWGPHGCGQPRMYVVIGEREEEWGDRRRRNRAKGRVDEWYNC